MNIQWYPGHMAKTKRLLLEQLRWVDVVIELGDAVASEAAVIPCYRIIGTKPKLLILNKSDLVILLDKRWLADYRKQVGHCRQCNRGVRCFADYPSFESVGC